MSDFSDSDELLDNCSFDSSHETDSFMDSSYSSENTDCSSENSDSSSENTDSSHKKNSHKNRDVIEIFDLDEEKMISSQKKENKRVIPNNNIYKNKIFKKGFSNYLVTSKQSPKTASQPLSNLDLISAYERAESINSLFESGMYLEAYKRLKEWIQINEIQNQISKKLIIEFLTEGLFKGASSLIDLCCSTNNFSQDQIKQLYSARSSELSSYDQFISKIHEEEEKKKENNEKNAALEGSQIIYDLIQSGQKKEACQFLCRWMNRISSPTKAEQAMFFEFLTVGEFAFNQPVLQCASNLCNKLFTPLQSESIQFRLKSVIQATSPESATIRKREIEVCVSQVQAQNTLSIKECLKFIENCFRNDDGDVECVGRPRFSLLDPVTLKRLKIPVRTKHCLHFNCFDLRGHCTRWLHQFKVGDQHIKGEWRCPICKADAKVSDLIVDSFAHSILNNHLTQSLEYVLISKSGEMKIPLPEEHDVIDLTECDYSMNSDEEIFWENYKKKLKICEDRKTQKKSSQNIYIMPVQPLFIPHIHGNIVDNGCIDRRNEIFHNHKYNLNLMNVKQMCILDGIGPITAKKIINYRNELGGKFTNMEELRPILNYRAFSTISNKCCV